MPKTLSAAADLAVRVAVVLAAVALLAAAEYVNRCYDEADRANRYAQCLPEAGQRTVAFRSDSGYIECSVETVGGYGTAPRPVRRARVQP